MCQLSHCLVSTGSPSVAAILSWLYTVTPAGPAPVPSFCISLVTGYQIMRLLSVFYNSLIYLYYSTFSSFVCNTTSVAWSTVWSRNLQVVCRVCTSKLTKDSRKAGFKLYVTFFSATANMCFLTKNILVYSTSSIVHLCRYSHLCTKLPQSLGCFCCCKPCN